MIETARPDDPGGRAWLRRWWPLLLPLAFLLANAYAGIDFGNHWDEGFMMRSVAHTALTGEWLPLYFNYPSAAYWLSAFASLPDFGTPENLFLTDALIRVRAVFALTFAVGMAAAYAITLRLTGRVLPAFVSAAVLAVSWEYVYHARWIAPDGLVVAFASSTALFCVIAVQNPARRRWLYIAAVTGGLTVGSKYNAGIFALTVPLAAWLIVMRSGETNAANRRERLFRLARLWLVLALIGLAAFLISTPGAVLATDRFITDIQEEIYHYSQMGHHNHTVDPGLDHLSRNLTYLGVVLFSGMMNSAKLITILALSGAFFGFAFAWVFPSFFFADRSPDDERPEDDRRGLWAIIVLPPLVYLLYMSMQQVMIVRNLLVIAPFIAVWAALGFQLLWNVWGKWLTSAVLALVLILSGGYQFYATQTVMNRADLDAYADDVIEHIERYSGNTFCVSSTLSAIFNERDYTPPDNVRYFEPVDFIIYSTLEVNPLEVAANSPNLYLRVFGPLEVNWNYYPDWGGDPRFVMVRGSRAEAMGIRIGNCRVGGGR